MWVATHLHSGNKIYLLSGREYTIGRVGSDIVLTDDTSISRSHALFQVSNESLKLEDKGSKYGTYHNEHIENKQKLLKGKLIDLKEGDRILFGALKNEWLISKNKINSMVSSLNTKDLVEIKNQLDLLGGTIISKWESRCTHLTMQEITITIKVLHALIEKIPIVSCCFWKDYLKNIQDKKEPPNPSDYLPKRSSQLSSAIQDEHLSFNENRKTLFAGKTFVFMTKKHFDMYSPIVIKAGGQCKDLKNNVSKSFLVKNNTIVVQYVASTQSQGTQTINSISEYLETKSLRTIPEYEIGLAIVCCTIEKYCNPSYSAISNILPNSAFGSPTFGTMLAENTGLQKSEINTLNSSYSEVPESDCVKNKAGPNKPLQSEVYDSEVIIIDDNPKSTKSMDSLSMDRESDIITKTNEATSEEIDKNEVGNLKDINFSDDDFSENLVLSSDLPLNENMGSKESSGNRKRPTTPIDVCRLNKKPRNTSPVVEKNREEIEKQEKPTEPGPSSVLTSKRNNPRVRPIMPGFLQKSQISHPQPDALQDSQLSVNKSIPAKRGRIALITDNDSDDDDDDIFNFGSSPKKSKPSGGCISDEDELFAFGNKSSRDEVRNAEHNSVEALPKTQPFIPNKKSSNSNNISSKIKVAPIKAAPDGWLSAMSILKIKCDDDIVKEEKNCSLDDLKHKEWIDSLKEGFEVRVRKMNLTSKGTNCSSISRDSSNNSLNNTKKNFKAFVKKNNYKTQTQVIPTFPTVVQPTCY